MEAESLAAKDDGVIVRLSHLNVAVVADVLDRLGYRAQVMDNRMRPLTHRHTMAGRAYPIQATPTSVIPENPYKLEIAAVDALPAGAIVVIATGDCYDAAIWGELLATRASAKGATGAVIDGAVRDLSGLNELVGLPTFAIAVNANDSCGRLNVVSYGSPVVCAGVGVSSSDYVLADLDGVVVVPGILAEEALVEAEAKRSLENLARDLLSHGASVADVYSRHKIL